MGSKGDDALSKRFWGDCNEISSSKTIRGCGSEFFVKFSILIFLANFWISKKSIFFTNMKIVNECFIMSKHCFWNTTIDTKHAFLMKYSDSGHFDPAEWFNKCWKGKFSLSSVNKQWIIFYIKTLFSTFTSHIFDDQKVCGLRFLTHFRM